MSATKAVILLKTRSDYDGGEVLGYAVVMVPKDLSVIIDEAAFYADLRGHPLYGGKWFRKDGHVHGRYANRARELWEANLKERFGAVPSELNEWPL